MSEVDWHGHAVLQVAVPELEDWIVARTRHYDAGFVSGDPRFHHAHITVLAPLRSWDAKACARLAAATRPFDYRLERIAVFPDGCIHLPPEPDESFHALTAAAWQAHPRVIPNGAPDPDPHLTLDRIGPGVDVGSTRALLGSSIPVTCRAVGLELVWYEAGDCHLIDSWPFSGREA